MTNSEKAKIWLSIGKKLTILKFFCCLPCSPLAAGITSSVCSNSQESGRPSSQAVTSQTACGSQGIKDWVWIRGPVTFTVQEKVSQGGHLRHMAPAGSARLYLH